MGDGASNVGTFGLLAFRSTCSLCLVPDFSLLASVRARCPSLVMGKAGRTGLPGVSFTLPGHERKLAFAPLRRLIVVLAARDHHVPGRSELALEAVRAGRKRLVEVVIPKASEVHLHGAEVDDRLVLAECRQPEETREIAIGDRWCGDDSRGDSLAVIMFQGDGQFAIEWR